MLQKLLRWNPTPDHKPLNSGCIGQGVKEKGPLISFAIELAVYAVIVFIYFFLVLHYLGDWIAHLYRDERKLYAIVALLLIVGQGIVLEMLTSALLRIIRRGKY
ncbi:MAG TPA: hypothetical protein VGE41_08825 [Verrucomicrobiae bacterium]|jgi:hypothetical protein